MAPLTPEEEMAESAQRNAAAAEDDQRAKAQAAKLEAARIKGLIADAEAGLTNEEANKAAAARSR